MKWSQFSIILLSVLWISCDDEYFPPGIYAEQVERLLSGGDQKTWTLSELQVDGARQEMESCQAKLMLHVYDTDSGLSIYQINECVPADTIYWGQGSASNVLSGENENLFTDTLRLSGGAYSYVLISDITSLQADMIRNSGGSQFGYQWAAGSNSD